MKSLYNNFLILFLVLFFAACNQNPAGHVTKKAKKRQPINYANYVIQVATYKIKKGVDPVAFSRLDSTIERNNTRKEPGYISKESGRDQKGNWLVVIGWDNANHAETAHKKFLHSPALSQFLNMIDTASINIKLFTVKNDQSNSTKDEKPYVIELAMFKEKSQVQRDTFEKRDLQVEADYISRQTGFITRRIGRAENGERLMMIYWKTLADADAGMKEFLTDQSVADYYKMIDWKTVDTKRFQAIN